MARRVKALDWSRHDKHIYEKLAEWFDVIGKQLETPAIVPENVYNMDETGALLSSLALLEVLVGKDNMRNYKRAGIKRTLVTAIEFISTDSGIPFPSYNVALRDASEHMDHPSHP
ncbi:hypothetical protein EJ02DRAFT_475569 [Clathrospora elynae]|uniref:DDE-1 domain-containing protein n=1 Tax=Clathrospora elynae TaxID=706981 RepID=A0A6A5SH48_9PLEO|nr:hypothetical protein EJ02DRAFT_475569 [Clathrospora elynae]